VESINNDACHSHSVTHPRLPSRLILSVDVLAEEPDAGAKEEVATGKVDPKRPQEREERVEDWNIACDQNAYAIMRLTG
jgi:hypothetical protein